MKEVNFKIQITLACNLPFRKGGKLNHLNVHKFILEDVNSVGKLSHSKDKQISFSNYTGEAN